ncbi:MAG: branched-chain amino acid transporter permease [Galactobacter sp.]|uniref:branched-chain amino acid transporter permease n=1 Tax=Galactobacter sp. TaxID=2676125 RepID=UPI0025C2CCB3|nr:AzlD domain-containing protein [Galactobacter sp.]
MPDWLYVLCGILVSAGITWALRAAPFAALAPLRKSKLLEYLGEHMPVGIMFILAFYTLKDTDVTSLGAAGPVCLALAVTVALHLWRGNMMLSIFGGTGVYVVLASVIAA